jgi:hypothetical protein
MKVNDLLQVSRRTLHSMYSPTARRQAHEAYDNNDGQIWVAVRSRTPCNFTLASYVILKDLNVPKQTFEIGL